MANFTDIKKTADSPQLVRKILEAVAFIGPEDAPDITSMLDVDGSLKALDPAYMPVGLVSPDGYVFGGDTSTEGVDALGYTQPVREDITSQTRTVAFTPYETYRRALLELAYGMDLSAIEASAQNEIVFDHPDRPLQKFYRFIVIGRDGSGANEWLRGKFFPRTSIASIPEETWSAATASQFPITLNTYVDDTIGTGERDFIAGSAVDPEELGFAVATP